MTYHDDIYEHSEIPYIEVIRYLHRNAHISYIEIFMYNKNPDILRRDTYLLQ